MFTACSHDDDDKNNNNNNSNNNGGENQTYTSFVVTNTNEGAKYKNVVAGYFTKDGKCKKIADVGDLGPNQSSNEIKIENSDVKEIFLFVTRVDNETYRMDPGHSIITGKKNEIKIAKNFTFVFVKKNDETQYPH